MEAAACLFFNDTATTEIYTLSLHDALPIFGPELVLVELARDVPRDPQLLAAQRDRRGAVGSQADPQQRPVLGPLAPRSEEHTSELQSRQYLVCRLLLEKKNAFLFSHHTLST